MNKIFICGDIHGDITKIENFITRNNNIHFDKTDKMILLGDVGLNYYLNNEDKKNKQKLNDLSLTFYCVRGNHEERPSIIAKNNPNNWIYCYDNEIKGMVYYEKNFPNIIYFDDKPSIYQIGKYKTLIMGGAYSIDKFYRLQNNYMWFKNEQMSIEEMKIVSNLCKKINWKIDLVLSHTCPAIFEPTDLFLSIINQNTVDKSMELFFNKIEYKLNYKAWIWGHYHEFRDYPRLDKKRKLMLFNDYLIELNQYMNEDIPKKL